MAKKTKELTLNGFVPVKINGGKRPGAGRKKKPDELKRVPAIVYVQAGKKDEFMVLANQLRDRVEASTTSLLTT